MAVGLHQLAAALYLAAAITAGVGISMSARWISRSSAFLLAAAGVVHGVSFGFFHTAEPPVPLTDLPAALSLAGFVAVVFSLLLLARARLLGLVVLVAPVAFLCAFFAALRLPHAAEPTFGGAGSWPHAHIVLASAGFAFLGVAGLAGLLFLTESRRLKAKRAMRRRFLLPSLEALDRVNSIALAFGFPLLTLGVVSGVLWVQSESGRPWTGSPHEWWTIVGWAIYAVLAGLRFGGGQGARAAATTAVAGSAFLLFAVVGVGLLQ